MYNQIIETIQKLMTFRRHVIVAIDGRCGGGKSTLAARLAEQLGGNVVHMDDFFLRPAMRTPERLNTAGENIDHERFLSEVLLPLRQGESFVYRPFDCARQDFGEEIQIIPERLTIIEGSYSCHDRLWQHYDLRIFVDIDPEEQLRRIVKRNPDSAAMFQNKWIPLEETYFDTFDIRNRCEIIYK